MQHGFIDQIDLTVTDIQLSCVFYAKVFGSLAYILTSEYEGDVPCWVLNRSGMTFSIDPHKAKVPASHNRCATELHHLASHLGSRAEIDSFHEFWFNENITILDTPTEYDYAQGYHALFFADPDGMKFELVYEPRFDSVVI